MDTTVQTVDEIFTEDFLKEIDFKLVKRTLSEYKPYREYGQAKKHMTDIFWNLDGPHCTYYGTPLAEGAVFFVIEKDAETRTAFSGYIFNQDDVRNLLRLTW